MMKRAECMASIVCWLGVFSIAEGNTTLYMLGLYPLSGPWRGGPGVRVSMEMGFEHINARKDILPGYQIKVIWEDTKCHPGYGVNNMYRSLYKPPQKLMILGAACSPVSEATALASHIWNIIQMSYVSSAPALSDKSRFPLFLRVSSPRKGLNQARIQLLKEFNWRRVATIHESLNIFSKLTDDLIDQLKENNITLISSEIFTDDPSQQISNLKRHDARIIIAECYEDKAYRLYCEIYKQKLYGPKYVWIVSGFYSPEWWLKGLYDSDCTPEQLTEVIQGIFSTEVLNINKDEVPGIAGLTPSVWKRMFDQRMVEGNVSTYADHVAPSAYDCAWVVALGLNYSLQLLKERGFNKTLEEFTYDDREMTECIWEALMKVEFQGIKAYKKFDENGDMDSIMKIERIQGPDYDIFGYFDPFVGTIEWKEDRSIIWEGGSPPPDSTTHIKKWIFVHQTTYIIMCLIAALGMVLSVGFFIFNFVYRNERLIKMSSPKMNNIILLGCTVAYMTVFLQELSDENIVIYCKVRTYTLMIGFSMAFGALFAKTWRVYAIFMNRTRRVVIKDEQLLLVVAAIVGIDVVIAVVREVVDPLETASNVIAINELDGGDVVITNHVWVCTSSYDIYFKGVIYAIKGLLLIFGAFLAMQTRKVKIPALNDSQYIGLCIYNVAVLSLLGVVLTFALSEQVDLSYIFTCSFIIIGTTLTQLIIFIPKIAKFNNQVEDEETKTQFGTMHNTNASTVDTTTSADKLKTLKEELEKKSKLLTEAEKKIEDLKKEIQNLKAAGGKGSTSKY